MSGERWHHGPGHEVRDENGLRVAWVFVAEDKPLVIAAPALRDALAAFVAECGGNPPDFLKAAHAAAEALLIELENT